MPIPPPVKAVLRKDLLLGGGAGLLLCAALVAGALTLGPLLGIDWGSSGSDSGGAEAARLPAIPAVTNPNADVLRARGRAPRVIARDAQPTTLVAAPRTPARPQAAPSVAGRTRQPTVAPTPTRTPSGGGPTGTPDVATVAPPAPVAAPGALAPATAIPATPAARAAASKKVKLRVASAAVEAADDGAPELRLSLGIDRAAAASGPAAVPDQVTVRLRPQLPSHAAATGPLALSATVDVVDGPANDHSDEGSVAVAGMQMRVRMSLSPAAASAPADKPSVADTGDNQADSQSQSNVIAL